MMPRKYLLLLAIFIVTGPWRASAVPSEIDSAENQQLVFSSTDIHTLRKTARAVKLSLYRNRDSDRHLLVIRCEADRETPADRAQVEAFRTECIRISEQLIAKLSGKILPIPPAEIQTADNPVCHYLWTTYDLVGVIPIQFTGETSKLP